MRMQPPLVRVVEVCLQLYIYYYRWQVLTYFMQDSSVWIHVCTIIIAVGYRLVLAVLYIHDQKVQYTY